MRGQAGVDIDKSGDNGLVLFVPDIEYLLYIISFLSTLTVLEADVNIFHGLSYDNMAWKRSLFKNSTIRKTVGPGWAEPAWNKGMFLVTAGEWLVFRPVAAQMFKLRKSE